MPRLLPSACDPRENGTQRRNADAHVCYEVAYVTAFIIERGLSLSLCPANKMSMAAAAGGELKVPAVSVLPAEDVAAPVADLNDKEQAVKRRARPGRKLNGVVRGDTRSLYISPTGISTLDIRTRLRISEAELAIVQREVADLISEKDQLESNARLYEESWKFAVQECGRIVEQRDDRQRNLMSLENAVSAAHHPENHKDSKKKKVTKADLDQCKIALETQTRVAETLEHERDQAYDDYQFAQAQLHTLMHQYQQLANTCSEVARERDKARTEAALLRDELHQYEPDPEPQGITLSRSASSRKVSETEAQRVSRTNLLREESSLGEGPSEDLPVEEQVKLLREEREQLRAMYDTVWQRSEQYQRQVQRADEERRQALATSEALTAVWQKKFEKAEQVQHELALELRSAENRIELLSQHLAMSRLQGEGPRHSPSEGELAKMSVNSSSQREWAPQPQRTASFHGSLGNSTTVGNAHNSSKSSLTKKPSHSSGSINKVFSRDRHTVSSSSVSSSTHELISPLNDQPHSKKRNRRIENSEDGAGTGSSQSTEDEASWI